MTPYKTLTFDKELELLDKLVDAYVVRHVRSCHYHVYFLPVRTNSLIQTLLYICWYGAIQISEGLLYLTPGYENDIVQTIAEKKI